MLHTSKALTRFSSLYAFYYRINELDKRSYIQENSSIYNVPLQMLTWLIYIHMSSVSWSQYLLMISARGEDVSPSSSDLQQLCVASAGVLNALQCDAAEQR